MKASQVNVKANFQDIKMTLLLFRQNIFYHKDASLKIYSQMDLLLFHIFLLSKANYIPELQLRFERKFLCRSFLLHKPAIFLISLIIKFWKQINFR